MSDTLAEHRESWSRKPILRAIYADYYRRMLVWAKPGTTLEIGGGTGNLKSFVPDIISTDIQFANWLDAVADAQRLPFAAESFMNIFMVDVLHHIEKPLTFLAEVARVLGRGGRLIVVEPAITPISHVVYRLFHPEPIDLSVDSLSGGSPSQHKDPYAANQAIPTLLFGRDRPRLEKSLPQLKVIAHEHLALWAYLLSGGFRPWSLLPAVVLPTVLRVEDKLIPHLGSSMAFRMLGVIEKR